jgi:hypothetical protein
MRIGSPEHKELFCRTFLDSHVPYEPEDLPWPDLDEDALAKLRAIPVWSMALQVEINAGSMLEQYCKTVRDPLIRQAIELQAYEETRHGRMLRTMIDRYDLPATVTEPQMEPTRRAFIEFGYNECLDSFFGFGVFRLAREVRFMPENLTSLFARVLYEEARHIVFFVNWVAYDRAERGYASPILQIIPTLLGYAGALQRTATRGREIGTADTNLAYVTEAFSDVTPEKFLAAAIAENAMHMATIDPRLLRPLVFPALAGAALATLRFLAKVKKPAAAQTAPA